jgi:hypothetical protein
LARARGPLTGEIVLYISPEQLDTLRAHITAGFDRATQLLCREHADDTGVEVRECHCCSLANFPQGAVCSDDDLIAGVLVRFEGGIAGTALLAMDPQNALDWVQAAGARPDPIATYLELGRLLLGEISRELASQFSAEIELSSASLQENCVGAVLLQTHAPSDTAVISTRFDIAAGDSVLPGYVYVLMEPKPLGSALGVN